jgi:UDP-N-acetylmuramoylalanine--D-glutamate ligase
MKLAGQRVVVAGAGTSGAAAARVLLAAGAEVTVADRVAGAGAEALAAAGARLALGLEAVPAGTSLVVTSPGWRPDAPLLASASAAGIEVIGEVELAWRLRGPDPAPWLAVTGTNGKTTTVRMLESMLRAAGLRAIATGNVGLPVVDVVTAARPYQVLAVELSSYQLHWSSSLRPAAAAVLNLAPDHLDWHGSYEAYAADKARIYSGDPVAIYNDDDLPAAALSFGARRRIGFTLAAPGPGMLGVADGVLVDRAFGDGAELASVAEVRPAGPHNVANALAAAALARAHGIAPAAVRQGLVGFVPDKHRNAAVATVAGVSYVDDSKATNPHAAHASLTAYPSIVWVAGGLLKGADVGELVAAVAPRLAGAVLLGRDREQIRAAIARHAPDLPVIAVDRTDDGAMRDIVAAAAGLAKPGDTVLLAPAAASMDMFLDYNARGDAFAAAVADLAEAAAAGRERP